MSNEKVIDTKNAKLNFCDTILYQISHLQNAIIDNNFHDFFHALAVLEKIFYKYDNYVNTQPEMVECFCKIEKLIFSNDLLEIVYNISKLESMVHATKDSINENSKE